MKTEQKGFYTGLMLYLKTMVTEEELNALDPNNILHFDFGAVTYNIKYSELVDKSTEELNELINEHHTETI